MTQPAFVGGGAPVPIGNTVIRAATTRPHASPTRPPPVGVPQRRPVTVMKIHSELPAWAELQRHADAGVAGARPHLRDLLNDRSRCEAMFAEHGSILLDYSRQLATPETLKLLFQLADQVDLRPKIQAMFDGHHLNTSEDRAVLHTALREDPPRPEVAEVLSRIQLFSDRVRDGEWLGVTGKPLTDVVSIGIGGSFLGPAFVHTALETEPGAQVTSAGRRLRFLANVDPEDVSRALSGLSAETTLVIVVSKTFTTAETMLNARTVREWLTFQLGGDAVAKHMVAVSTAGALVEDFGILPENTFGFWDWVGGRYSVSSAVGVLPLSLQYGYEMVAEFLAGMRDIDNHFRTAPWPENIPVLMGLFSTWNATFNNLPSNAILPYCQALSKLAPHIQQVSMESNGKSVSVNGEPLNFGAGEVIFGEPGTNGQHSFYQLIHQGRVVPCDFIGLAQSQQRIFLDGEAVSNHDELMSNFFAQADALAVGKTAEDLSAEGTAPELIPHKTFSGNRPSLSLLLGSLGPFEVGQVLALYEHRIAVQGFLWGINSFDQWGVELGKVLATKMRGEMSRVRKDGGQVAKTEEDEAKLGFNYSTTRMLSKYFELCELGNGMLYKDAFKSPFDEFIPCVGIDCSLEEEEEEG